MTLPGTGRGRGLAGRMRPAALREGSRAASTGETMPGPRDAAAVAGQARTEAISLQARTSPQAAAFIGERGGSLYVWVTTVRCCGGVPVRIVRSSTGAPRGVTGFRRFDAGGFQVLLHPSAGRTPQMEVRLRGRWRPRITVYWDGMPI